LEFSDHSLSLEFQPRVSSCEAASDNIDWGRYRMNDGSGFNFGQAQPRVRSNLDPASWNFARWAPIPLRLIVGYGFVAHGYAKLLKGPDNFIAIVHAIGVPAPFLMGWATIVLELACGAAVLAGAFVPLVSIPMAAILLVAIFTVHLQFGFTSIKLMAVTFAGPQFGPPGYECDLLYLACLAALVLGGSGPWSVDAILIKQWRLLRSRPMRQAKAQRAERVVTRS
jgi:putative oxidoreductase